MPKKSDTLLTRDRQNLALCATFGALCVVAGVLAGGSVGSITLLVGAFCVLGWHVARRGWLNRAGRSASWPRRLRDAAVIASCGLFSAAYVTLTGGGESPLSFALTLPLALAAISFGTTAGLASGLGMAVVYLFGIRGFGHWDRAAWEAALSFPLFAVFVSLLVRRHEASLHNLYTRAQDLAALLDMSQMMDAAVDLEMSLNLVLLNAQKISDGQVCAIYLTTDGGRRLDLRSSGGSRRPALASLSVDEARMDGWWVAAPQEGDRAVALSVADGQSTPGSRLCEIDPKSCAFVCLPLASIEGLIGMLYVGFDQPGALPRSAREHLESLATRAAFSLQRSLVQENVQSLAFRDPMTGLDNFRQFDRSLTEELHRAERYGGRLSLLLLDIDHFKKFNDTLGHQAGDALLGQLGAILHDCLRSVDKPARYGGEEFVIICPESGREDARRIGERVRQTVEATPFSIADGAPPAHVTVSVGCATYPLDADRKADLIKRADEALYAAKHAGRNAVRSAEETAPMDAGRRP